MVPVPSSIPRRAWLKTSLRIQHVGSMTRERREARFAKYREADPECTYQSSYAALLDDPPHDAPLWLPREPHLPVLIDQAGHPSARYREDDHALGPSPPALSAIVIAHDDEAIIERAVRSVACQQCSEPFEVIVVTSGSDRTAQVVTERFPHVKLVTLPGTAFPGKARNAGLHLARGEFVSFPGSHVELPPGSLEARLQAHRQGFPMVTGSVENGTRTWAGWASYFIDHHDHLPGCAREVLPFDPPSCSYRRDILLDCGGFPEDMRSGEDTAVNVRLHGQGFLTLREPAARFIHHSPCTTPRRLVKHHFTRGRGLARVLLSRRLSPDANAATRIRFLRRFFMKRRMRRQLAWTSRNIWRNAPERRLTYICAFPLILLGLIANRCGTWYGFLRQ
jgi:glycosyltransferase involved in cell wall biosynthesis